MRARALAMAVGLALAWPGTAASQVELAQLRELSLEELASVEVTSPSRRAEPLSGAAAAIHVITQEDIRRSGATTLVEALRLAPGVHVARIDANKWAVGVRGFTTRLSRSTLVLIDGRSVYNPLFAGVYWEVQDTFLEDIDRIEVIRGPGGTLWGANAVNGVINVITKSAAQTQGTHVRAIAGTEENGSLSVRYGGSAGARTWHRVYAKGYDRDGGFHAVNPEYDEWSGGIAGFRAERTLGPATSLTVQGDAYDGDFGQRASFATFEPPHLATFERDADLSGGNLLARWRRERADEGLTTVQVFWDRTRRHELPLMEHRNTWDVDVEQRLPPMGTHQLVWGGGYRRTRDRTEGVPTIGFVPSGRAATVWSLFGQDEITLAGGRARTSLGAKVEYNEFTGVEVQPSVRLALTPSPERTLWAAVSRAIRSPSRLEDDVFLTAFLSPTGPTFARIVGNREFDSERLIAYEIGYRDAPGARVLVDVAAFYNDYDDLLSQEVAGAPFVEPTPEPAHVIVPFVIGNGVTAHTYGAELSTRVAVTPRWHVTGSYSHLRIDVEPKPGSTDVGQETLEGNSPRHMVSLQSTADLTRALQLDVVYRYVGALETFDVEAYHAADLRLAWRPSDALELSIVGRNLLDDHHAEIGRGIGRVDVERDVFGKVSWRF